MTKTYKVLIQPDAVDDLDRIYQFIATDNPKRAKSFVNSLKKKILELNRFPHRGSRCQLIIQDKQDVFQELRFISHKGYLIFYDVSPSEVLVLHVTGPGKNWITLFL